VGLEIKNPHLALPTAYFAITLKITRRRREKRRTDQITQAISNPRYHYQHQYAEIAKKAKRTMSIPLKFSLLNSGELLLK